MQVKTLRRHSYNRKVHAPGDTYEIANPKHVQILEAVKRIERVPEKITVPIVNVPKKETVKKPKPKPKEIVVKPKPKPKRKIKDKSMKSEDIENARISDDES